MRAKLAGSRDVKDGPILDLTWDYPLLGAQREPDAEAIMQEVNGRRADGSFIATYEDSCPPLTGEITTYSRLCQGYPRCMGMARALLKTVPVPPNWS